jgi:hypothetical protein
MISSRFLMTAMRMPSRVLQPHLMHTRLRYSRAGERWLVLRGQFDTGTVSTGMDD